MTTSAAALAPEPATLASNPMPDSATALRHAVLFSGLGRVELAKLAAELEEVRFKAGEYVVREGAAGDAFYVVKAGEAEVFVGAQPENTATPILLRQDECFGEMSLLTGSPRTASVVARTPLVVWRLSSVRFNTLLARERGIASTIERALSERLAAQTAEASQLKRLVLQLGGSVEALPPPTRTQPSRPISATKALQVTPQTGIGQQIVRALISRNGLAGISAAAILILSWLVPLPDGLGRGGMVAFGALMSTVPLATSGLPGFAVYMITALALVIPGVATAKQILGGFASTAWLLILVLGCVTAGIARSGLLFRLALISLKRLPAGFNSQSLALSSAGVGLTAGVTSGSARISLGVPIARAISEAMSYAPRSRGAAALGLITFLAFSQLETLFLTGSTGNLIVHGLLPDAARERTTWGVWLMAAFLPHFLLFVLDYLAVLFLLRPPRPTSRGEMVRLQEELLGPPTRSEILGGLALIAIVIGFAAKSYIGLEPVWVSALIFLGLYFVGAVDNASIETGTSVQLLLTLGIMLSLPSIFTAQGIDKWLSTALQTRLPAVGNPYVFVLLFAAVAFALHFAVSWVTASSVLALVAMPLASAAGIDPLVPVLTVMIAGNHTALPHLNSAYAIVYASSEGELFEHDQARPLLWLDAVFRLLVLVASVPYWHALKLL